MQEIMTERLKIITFTVEMMEALLKGHDELRKLIPYCIAPEWPLEEYKQLFLYKINRFHNFPHENEWEGIIIHKSDNCIIGDMGFKGGPNEKGIIDIGYSIVPRYRGKGYATEMGKAMVEWGLSQPGVNKAIATCNSDNFASIRVLEKIGFHITKKSADKLYWTYEKNGRR
ncbi:GNAT family N-acetyltransferase [Metabacillus sediminilitoris]|uniref:GNAT family N-acetyltransferase n=1 Tax=Metabacillus sediminilitoris TaxID=2567941 RepID=A0A4S4BVZ7_9BACI|nr:GNAT family N-acetyltransferase [Metabacillus sediminilitoris]QGQ44978.1 GNAT family N-acetyltransferase [Metabacillus sediminilitoris]THF78611.1 GNAT family N-acetyltransferase [Metabacillus sediminilitoris]